MRITHGKSRSNGKATKTYCAWSAMLFRCYNPNSPEYKNYGGRGIGVCDEWRHSFVNFLNDLGEAAPGTSIERVDVNGNYEPSNCKWIERSLQCKNKRDTRIVTLRGEKMIAADAAKKLGIGKEKVYYMLARGVPPDKLDEPDALEKLSSTRPKFFFQGQKVSLAEYCRMHGYNYDRLQSRRKRGKPMEEWLTP
jgi:hypothetical protein